MRDDRETTIQRNEDLIEINEVMEVKCEAVSNQLERVSKELKEAKQEAALNLSDLTKRLMDSINHSTELEHHLHETRRQVMKHSQQTQKCLAELGETQKELSLRALPEETAANADKIQKLEEQLRALKTRFTMWSVSSRLAKSPKGRQPDAAAVGSTSSSSAVESQSVSPGGKEDATMAPEVTSGDDHSDAASSSVNKLQLDVHEEEEEDEAKEGKKKSPRGGRRKSRTTSAGKRRKSVSVGKKSRTSKRRSSVIKKS